MGSLPNSPWGSSMLSCPALPAAPQQGSKIGPSGARTPGLRSPACLRFWKEGSGFGGRVSMPSTLVRQPALVSNTAPLAQPPQSWDCRHTPPSRPVPFLYTAFHWELLSFRPHHTLRPKGYPLPTLTPPCHLKATVSTLKGLAGSEKATGSLWLPEDPKCLHHIQPALTVPSSS